MAVPKTHTDAENKKIDAKLLTPTRSSAIANNADGAQNVVQSIDVSAFGAAGGFSLRFNRYVLTAVPTDVMLPNSKIGDEADVYLFDTDQSTTAPYDFKKFIKNADGWTEIAMVAAAG